MWRGGPDVDPAGLDPGPGFAQFQLGALATGPIFPGRLDSLEPAELERERAAVSSEARMLVWPHQGIPAKLGPFPTRRRALAFLATWREPDAIFPGMAPPFQPPGSSHWVLGFETPAVLSDAGCIALLFRGCEFGRPQDGFDSTIVRQYHLDDYCPPVTHWLLHCARIYASVREGLVALLTRGVPPHPSTLPHMAVMGGMRAAMARLIIGLDAPGQTVDPEPGAPGARWAGGLEMWAARAEQPRGPLPAPRPDAAPPSARLAAAGAPPSAAAPTRAAEGLVQ